MNDGQALAIKTYCEGAYPNMKKDSNADLVWIDMLKDYEYNGILMSVKKHILSGNKFAPSLAEIIKGYEMILTSNNEKLVYLVAKELDVSDERHLESIRNIIYHPNLEEILKHDEWLPNAIKKCKGMLINQLFTPNSKLLE